MPTLCGASCAGLLCRYLLGMWTMDRLLDVKVNLSHAVQWQMGLPAQH